MNALDSLSTRPYLIRALYEWCTDNGLTPYVAVAVDDTVLVPREYVKNNEIVLNISFDATSSLKLGNDFIEFKARFAGSARDIMVPISNVIAIYARENGQGMAFPAHLPTSTAGAPGASAVSPMAAAPEPDLAPEHKPAEGKIVQLVPGDASHAKDAEEDGDGPPPPPPKPRNRPSLKRVK
jgi:stringent starvation protein B